MRRLPLLASNSDIASISINFRSGEAVRATTDRSGPTGNVPLHENRLVGRESVGCVQPVDAPEPFLIPSHLNLGHGGAAKLCKTLRSSAWSKTRLARALSTTARIRESRRPAPRAPSGPPAWHRSPPGCTGCLFEPHPKMNPVDPQVDILLVGQTAPLPACTLLEPYRLHAANVGRREPRRTPSQQRTQLLPRVTRRSTAVSQWRYRRSSACLDS